MAALNRPEVWIPLAAVLVGFSLAALFRVVTLHYARRRGSRLAAVMARHATRPVFLLLPAFLGRFVQPLLHLAPGAAPSVRHAGETSSMSTRRPQGS